MNAQTLVTRYRKGILAGTLTLSRLLDFFVFNVTNITDEQNV